jgi:cobalt/nickel transport system permease protein
MIQERFASGDSVVHRLDPRLKVIFATVYSFVVALSWTFASLLTALIFSFILTALAQLDFRTVSKRLAFVNGFILFFWLLLPLTVGGEPLFFLGPFAVAREAVFLSARITLKSNAILLAVFPLLTSMPIATLGHTLHRLHVPEKIVYLFLLTYRYVFVISKEYQRIVRAAKIRGFHPRTNVHTYRTYAYFIGMLFVKASARAQRVHLAMLCRGFKGKFYCLREFSMSSLDWAFSSLMAAAILGLGILEWIRMI